MRSKHEVISDPYDIFAIFMVLVPQSFQNFDFNFSLLVKFFPILEDLDGDMLFGFVVKAPKDHSEGTPS